MRYWVVDDQVKIGDEPQVRLVRRVLEVLTPEGLNGAASVDVVFDPIFEQLAVHFVRVIRGGEVRELSTAEAFEVFRREPDLERAKFDGRLTAHMIIPDLRVGDVVDYCWSITGENPALKRRSAHWRTMQWGIGVDSVRFRLLAPPDRTFSTRHWGDEPEFHEGQYGSLTERTWTSRAVEPFRPEPATPPEWIANAAVLVSEVLSWSEVADIFRDAYARPHRGRLTPRAE